jgi:hypothetical protein
MVRAAMAWLVVGGLIGIAMTADPWLPGAWRVRLQPTHLHLLAVGTFLQFALGVAIWLFPRQRTPDLPLGYRERPVFALAAALNAGLVVRLIFEPLSRAGHDRTAVQLALVAGAALQGIALLGLAIHIWRRARPRARVAPTRSPVNEGVSP